MILFYNSDIWLIPSLKPRLFQQLLSASASALKMLSFSYDNTISFDQPHSFNNRATPKKLMAYRHALLLFKIFNDVSYSKDWLSLNFQLFFNARNQTVNVWDKSRIKFGKNLAVNRLKHINGKIGYDWLNLSFESYKVKCKSLFLRWIKIVFLWIQLSFK